MTSKYETLTTEELNRILEILESTNEELEKIEGDSDE